MITIKNLSISFKNHQVVRSISFALSAKKITALVGQSGSGKSTVALAIIKLLRGAQTSGEIVFDNKNLLQLNEKELQKIRGKDIGIIFQDPNTSLNPLHRIGKQIAEAITIHNPKISKKDLEKRVIELLKMVELDSLSSRLNDYPHQLSGGQKQRVMIAIALANNPKVLIADEPTTALDIKIQNEILDLIARLKNELGIAVLFITHNLRAVRRIADEIIEIKDGELAEKESLVVGTPNVGTGFVTPSRGSLMTENRDGVTNPVPTTLTNPVPTQEIVAPSELLVDSCQLLVNSNSFSPTTNNQQPTTILKVTDLSVSYQKKRIISGLNFSLKAGENLGVIGESGSGKSTLALALLNLIKSQGEIKFFGDKTWQKNNFDLRREVQIVFQDPFSSLDPRMTVQQIIEEGLVIHKKLLVDSCQPLGNSNSNVGTEFVTPSRGSFADESRDGVTNPVSTVTDQVSTVANPVSTGDSCRLLANSNSFSPTTNNQQLTTILDKLHLPTNLLTRYPHQLSGGQRQRVAIARALILNPKILILDEPTSALDSSTQDEILKLLINIQKQQEISYILISHDLEVIAQICDKIMVMKQGMIIESGTKSQIINSPCQPYTKELMTSWS